LDYYVWGVLERETNKTHHNSLESLKAAIIESVANMDKAHLIKACQRFPSRLEAFIEAEGSWIK
jgi:hypothetical protein